MSCKLQPYRLVYLLLLVRLDTQYHFIFPFNAKGAEFLQHAYECYCLVVNFLEVLNVPFLIDFAFLSFISNFLST